MSYIHTQTNQYPISEADIRSAYPNTSFPTPFIPPSEYAVVFPSPYPTYEPATQYVREGAPVLSSKGQYEQAWEVIELFETSEDKEAAIAADLEAKRIALVPAQVTMRQAELALLNADLLDDIEALVETLPRQYQIEWKRASVVHRDNALVELVREQKAMTTLQIDDLFMAANVL